MFLPNLQCLLVLCWQRSCRAELRYIAEFMQLMTVAYFQTHMRTEALDEEDLDSDHPFPGIVQSKPNPLP